MNLTALLDVSTQRSAIPLDRAVGDGGSDPAFANVMSRYHGNDSDSLAQGTADSESEPVPTESDGSANGGGVPVLVDASGVMVDATSMQTTADDPGSGEVLPVLIVPDGQLLPPTAGAAAVRDSDSSPSDYMGRPRPDDDLDAIDTGEATQFAVPLPIPPTAPTAWGGTAATVPLPMPAVVDSSAPRLATIAGASTAALSTGVDGGSASSAPEKNPQPSTPLLAGREALGDGDPGTKSAYPAAVSKVVPSPGSQTSVATDLRTGSSAGLVGVAGQASTGDGRDGSTNSGTAQQGDPQGQPDDALRGAGAPRFVTAQFAAAVSSAAQTDATGLQSEAPVDSVRTDAVAQRSNASDGARELAPTRLGELAQQHAPRLAGELAERVLVLRSQRFDSATVILEPRDLGRIDIQVRLQADATHITFTAQHATVRDALEGQLPRLRALLEEAGLSLGMVDVSQSGSRNGGEASTSRPSEHAKPTTVGRLEATESSMRWQRRIEASIIDLHA